METSSDLLGLALRDGRTLARELRTTAGNLRLNRSRLTDNVADGLGTIARELDRVMDEVALARIVNDVAPRRTLAGLVYDDDEDLPVDRIEQCGVSINHGRNVCQREFAHPGPHALFGF